MDISIDSYRTPGQLISFLLKERGWTGQMLSAMLDVDEATITRIVQDKKTISAEFAITLEEIFGSNALTAELILGLQSQFEIAKARFKAVPDLARNSRVKLFGELPVNEMIKRCWIAVEDKKDYAKLEEEILKFFAVSSLDHISSTPHAAKKTNSGYEANSLQIAWLSRVKQISQGLITAPYSQASGLKAIAELKNLLISVEAIRHVPKILAEHGIRFVVVEPLKGSKIDGVCFWLSENKPVIGMSLRFDRIDNFWFVLRHELEHVVQGHGREFPIIDEEMDGSNLEVNEEEKIANFEAQEFCVPMIKMDSFILRKSPFFTDADIRGFANTLKVHPGLVAGQLRHRTKKYTLFAKHLVKIRSIIIPNADADGWGDVYPIDS